MKYLDKSLKELSELIQSNKLDPKDLILESIETAKQYQSTLNPFVTILEDFNLGSNTNSPLYGIPYALKDNFSTKGILSTGSSNTLKQYIPVFDSTVYSKLKNSGAVCIGKTVLDELALGGTGLNGHTGVVHNPYDLNRLSGGSSAGSAVAVSSGIVPFAIGSDTGDSVRKPAAYNGIVGYKPTWGKISRFGLFPFATSLDHVGIFTRNVLDLGFVFNCIKGYDSKDMSSLENDNIDYTKLDTNLKGKKLGVIKTINNSISNPLVKQNYLETIEKIKQAGVEIVERDIDERLLKAILPTYLVISCSEATSNDACLDGIKYGTREDGDTYIKSIMNTRTNNFSELVKRRFVIGAYSLSSANQERIFKRAQKVRRLIVDSVKEIFKECDGIIFPAAGDISPLASSTNNEKLSNEFLIGENHLAIANFGGFPSLTLPCGFVNNMPVAINITCDIFKDKECLDISSGIEQVLGFKNQIKRVGE